MSDTIYMIIGSLGLITAIGIGVYTLIKKHRNWK